MSVTVDVFVALAPSRAGTSRLAHAVLRAQAARRLGIADDAVTIERCCSACGSRAHGKPTIAGAPFHVSIAHSGTVAIVAVGTGARVGVDVEVMRPRRYLDRLAARTFCPSELDEWRALPAGSQLDAFVRGWTAKEAYLKAIGVGLAVPLHEIDARPDGWTTVVLADTPAGCITTVAVDAPIAGVEVTFLDPPTWIDPDARRPGPEPGPSRV